MQGGVPEEAPFPRTKRSQAYCRSPFLGPLWKPVQLRLRASWVWGVETGDTWPVRLLES